MKKRVLCLMALLLVAVLLIGCGGTAETPTALSTVPPEEQSAPNSTLAPSTEPPPTPESGSQSPAPSVKESTPVSPRQVIAWDEARYYIDENVTVCGPVVSARYDREQQGEPTFLYIGNPYPAPHRFNVVIWEQDRDNFDKVPDRYYVGKTIYVRGLITEDKGIPQIEVKTPNQIREQ